MFAVPIYKIFWKYKTLVFQQGWNAALALIETSEEECIVTFHFGTITNFLDKNYDNRERLTLIL